MVSFPDILQLPCRRLYEIRQPPTSSYNFQFPHGRRGHGGRGEPGGQGEHGGQDRTGHFRKCQVYIVFACLCLILSIYNDFYASNVKKVHNWYLKAKY